MTLRHPGCNRYAFGTGPHLSMQNRKQRWRQHPRYPWTLLGRHRWPVCADRFGKGVETIDPHQSNGLDALQCQAERYECECQYVELSCTPIFRATTASFGQLESLSASCFIWISRYLLLLEISASLSMHVCWVPLVLRRKLATILAV